MEVGKLYLLQDGTHADPADVDTGKDGVLRHKNGLAVCLYSDGKPQTVEEDAVRNMNVEAAKTADAKTGEPKPPVEPMMTPKLPAAPAPAPAPEMVPGSASSPAPAPAPSATAPSPASEPAPPKSAPKQ